MCYMWGGSTWKFWACSLLSWARLVPLFAILWKLEEAALHCCVMGLEEMWAVCVLESSRNNGTSLQHVSIWLTNEEIFWLHTRGFLQYHWKYITAFSSAVFLGLGLPFSGVPWAIPHPYTLQMPLKPPHPKLSQSLFSSYGFRSLGRPSLTPISPSQPHHPDIITCISTSVPWLTGGDRRQNQKYIFILPSFRNS